MNRLFIKIFTFILITSIIGISVKLHFCGNELADVSIIDYGKCSCEKSSKGVQKCCKDVVIRPFISEYVGSVKASLSMSLIKDILFDVLINLSIYDIFETLGERVFYSGESPPLLFFSVYLNNCCLRC